MGKLSKSERSRHDAACAVLQKTNLNDDDREQVFTDWHPGAVIDAGKASAFFTPPGLAYDFEIDAHSHGRILDACAGIGVLSWVLGTRYAYSNSGARPDVTAIESNPAFVEIGRKLLPWVNWIQGDIFDPGKMDLGPFDAAMANAPFGRTQTETKSPRYKGACFELKLIDMLADHCDYGAFIIPQMSAPFDYSGRQRHRRRHTTESKRFEDQTGLILAEGCGVDCAYYKDDWHGVAPSVEIVTIDYDEQRDVLKSAPQQLKMAV